MSMASGVRIIAPSTHISASRDCGGTRPSCSVSELDRVVVAVTDWPPCLEKTEHENSGRGQQAEEKSDERPQNVNFVRLHSLQEIWFRPVAGWADLLRIQSGWHYYI
jgi:hypothetical protein